MQTLTVLKFNNPDGADRALDTLKSLQRQQLITIVDAAVVKWPPGKKGPETKQAYSTTGPGALSGSFWGLLFGLIFFIPLLGLAIGAAMGAMAVALTDVGISDDFIKSVRRQVTEGTSALFLMSQDAQVQRVIESIKPQNPEIIATNLSAEQEATLRELFTPAAAA